MNQGTEIWKKDKRRTRMNIILVIMDSLRKDHVGAYGNDWIQTPHVTE